MTKVTHFSSDLSHVAQDQNKTKFCTYEEAVTE